MTNIYRYNDRKSEIGERIKAERKDRKMTQDELSTAASSLLNSGGTVVDTISQGTISAWERGKTMPPIEKIACLAEIFGCDIGYLLCDYNDTFDIKEATGLSGAAADRLRNMWVRIQNEHAAGYTGTPEEQELSAINTLLECDYTILINIYQYLHSDYNAFSMTISDDNEPEKDIFDKEVLLCNDGDANKGVFVSADKMQTVFLLKVQEELGRLRHLLHKPKKGKNKK